MPIITTRTVSVSTQESIKCLQCDKCAREFEDVGFADANIIKLSGGYGNSFPSDMENMQIVVCGPCTQEWVESFKIKPQSNYWQASTCFALDGTPHWYYGNNEYYVSLRSNVSEGEWKSLWSYALDALGEESSLGHEGHFMPGSVVVYEGAHYELIGTLLWFEDSKDKTFEVFFLAHLCDGKSVHPVIIPLVYKIND